MFARISKGFRPTKMWWVQPGKTIINVDKIALNFKNLVPNTTSFQLFNSIQTFPQLKIIFFWLEICQAVEICQRLGNCRLCFLSNEIRTNVNANSWITYEQNSSMELFLSILVSSPSISLSRHVSSIPCQLKPCFSSKSAIWETPHFDWTIP